MALTVAAVAVMAVVVVETVKYEYSVGRGGFDNEMMMVGNVNGVAKVAGGSFVWMVSMVLMVVSGGSLVWRVGNGASINVCASINVWTGPWISVDSAFYISSDAVRGFEDLRVSRLCSVDNLSWDVDLVTGLFSPLIAARILAMTMHIPALELPDELWSKLWGLKVQPKVLHFLWRACRNILPVKEVLISRAIISEGVCPACGGQESILHAIVTYPSVHAHWTFVGFSFTNAPLIGFRELLWCVLNSLARDRCFRIGNGSLPAQQRFRQSAAPAAVPQVCWTAHLVGRWKCNVDAAVRKDLGRTKFGALVRDHSGEFVMGCFCHSSGVYALRVVEDIAVCEVLSYLRDNQLHGIQVETDCLQPVNAILDCTEDFSDWSLIIHDIKILFQQRDNVCIA
ncbi:uncharacterized protein LOC105636353 [Jatropha curcas]|uniref:uncharacterized protein LOC105636353 n=1 Tax=Jatropha curcas TaxID=180498 RepID=UPI0005FBC76B|nr:uncharacterized protein LOC105636353 [Jatropha curcas]